MTTLREAIAKYGLGPSIDDRIARHAPMIDYGVPVAGPTRRTERGLAGEAGATLVAGGRLAAGNLMGAAAAISGDDQLQADATREFEYAGGYAPLSASVADSENPMMHGRYWVRTIGEILPQMVATIGVGAATSGAGAGVMVSTGAVMGTTAALEGGRVYTEAVNRHGDKNKARLEGAAVGAAIGAIEYLPGSSYMADVNQFFRRSLTSSLATGARNAVGKKELKRLAGQIFTGGITEVSQEIAEDAILDFAEADYDGFKDWASRYPEVFLVGAVADGLMSAPGSAARALHRRARTQELLETDQRQQDIREGVGKSLAMKAAALVSGNQELLERVGPFLPQSIIDGDPTPVRPTDDLAVEPWGGEEVYTAAEVRAMEPSRSSIEKLMDSHSLYGPLRSGFSEAELRRLRPKPARKAFIESYADHLQAIEEAEANGETEPDFPSTPPEIKEARDERKFQRPQTPDTPAAGEEVTVSGKPGKVLGSDAVGVHVDIGGGRTVVAPAADVETETKKPAPPRFTDEQLETLATAGHEFAVELTGYKPSDGTTLTKRAGEYNYKVTRGDSQTEPWRGELIDESGEVVVSHQGSDMDAPANVAAGLNKAVNGSVAAKIVTKESKPAPKVKKGDKVEVPGEDAPATVESTERIGGDTYHNVETKRGPRLVKDKVLTRVETTEVVSEEGQETSTGPETDSRTDIQKDTDFLKRVTRKLKGHDKVSVVTDVNEEKHADTLNWARGRGKRVVWFRGDTGFEGAVDASRGDAIYINERNARATRVAFRNIVGHETAHALGVDQMPVDTSDPLFLEKKKAVLAKAKNAGADYAKNLSEDPKLLQREVVAAMAGDAMESRPYLTRMGKEGTLGRRIIDKLAQLFDDFIPKNKNINSIVVRLRKESESLSTPPAKVVTEETASDLSKFRKLRAESADKPKPIEQQAVEDRASELPPTLAKVDAWRKSKRVPDVDLDEIYASKAKQLEKTIKNLGHDPRTFDNADELAEKWINESRVRGDDYLSLISGYIKNHMELEADNGMGITDVLERVEARINPTELVKRREFDLSGDLSTNEAMASRLVFHLMMENQQKNLVTSEITAFDVPDDAASWSAAHIGQKIHWLGLLKAVVAEWENAEKQKNTKRLLSSDPIGRLLNLPMDRSGAVTLRFKHARDLMHAYKQRYGNTPTSEKFDPENPWVDKAVSSKPIAEWGDKELKKVRDFPDPRYPEGATDNLDRLKSVAIVANILARDTTWADQIRKEDAFRRHEQEQKIRKEHGWNDTVLPAVQDFIEMDDGPDTRVLTDGRVLRGKYVHGTDAIKQGIDQGKINGLQKAYAIGYNELIKDFERGEKFKLALKRDLVVEKALDGELPHEYVERRAMRDVLSVAFNRSSLRDNPGEVRKMARDQLDTQLVSEAVTRLFFNYESDLLGSEAKKVNGKETLQKNWKNTALDAMTELGMMIQTGDGQLINPATDRSKARSALNKSILQKFMDEYTTYAIKRLVRHPDDTTVTYLKGHPMEIQEGQMKVMTDTLDNGLYVYRRELSKKVDQEILADAILKGKELSNEQVYAADLFAENDLGEPVVTDDRKYVIDQEKLEYRRQSIRAAQKVQNDPDAKKRAEKRAEKKSQRQEDLSDLSEEEQIAILQKSQEEDDTYTVNNEDEEQLSQVTEQRDARHDRYDSDEENQSGEEGDLKAFLGMIVADVPAESVGNRLTRDPLAAMHKWFTDKGATSHALWVNRIREWLHPGGKFRVVDKKHGTDLVNIHDRMKNEKKRVSHEVMRLQRLLRWVLPTTMKREQKHEIGSWLNRENQMNLTERQIEKSGLNPKQAARVMEVMRWARRIIDAYSRVVNGYVLTMYEEAKSIPDPDMRERVMDNIENIEQEISSNFGAYVSRTYDWNDFANQGTQGIEGYYRDKRGSAYKDGDPDAGATSEWLAHRQSIIDNVSPVYQMFDGSMKDLRRLAKENDIELQENLTGPMAFSVTPNSPLKDLRRAVESIQRYDKAVDRLSRRELLDRINAAKHSKYYKSADKLIREIREKHPEMEWTPAQAEIYMRDKIFSGPGGQGVSANQREGSPNEFAAPVAPLMERVNVDEDTAWLWGEQIDPVQMLSGTISRLGNLNAAYKAQAAVRALPVFSDDPSKAGDGWLKVTPDRLEDLGLGILSGFKNGYVKDHETLHAVLDAKQQAERSLTLGLLGNISYMGKAGKTKYSPASYVRNAAGTLIIDIAMGNASGKHSAKAWKGAMKYFWGSAKNPEVQETGVVIDGVNFGTAQDMIDMGLLDSNLMVGIMKSIRPDKAGMGKMQESGKHLASSVGAEISERASAMYQFGDEYFKVKAYISTTLRLRDIYGNTKSEAEIKAEALRRVKNQYHNYTQLPQWARELSKWPFAASFVAFPTEMWRTTFASIKDIYQDIRSDNAEIRAWGYKRAASMAGVVLGTIGLSAASAASMGMSAEEERQRREMLPRWDRKGSIFWLGNGYVNMSHTVPYSVVLDALGSMVRSGPVAGAMAMAEPYMGSDIGFSVINALWNNEDASSGTQIANPDDPLIDRVLDMGIYFSEQLAPGIYDSMERNIKAWTGTVEDSGRSYGAGREALALLGGMRIASYDPGRTLHFRMREVRERLGNSEWEFRKLIRARGNRVSESRLDSTYRNSERLRQEIMAEALDIYQAAIGSGVDPGQAYLTMKNALGSDRLAGQVAAGIYVPYIPSRRDYEHASKYGGQQRVSDVAAVIQRGFDATDTP